MERRFECRPCRVSQILKAVWVAIVGNIIDRNKEVRKGKKAPKETIKKVLFLPLREKTQCVKEGLLAF